MDDRSVDLLYLAFNRLEFTRETFTALIDNTDWRYISEFFVYDDGSTDGTCEWLEEAVRKIPAKVRFQKTSFGSPVTAMLHFIEASSAPIMAKTDNDAMLPPHWLRRSLEVLDRNPDLDLLGIEAMVPEVDNGEVLRSYMPSDFISGLGLYRRRAFSHSRPQMFRKYYGLEEWQMPQKQLKRGWISPALPVFLLDRCPLQPWFGLSQAYIKRGWQRPWQGYDASCTLWDWCWPSQRDGNLRLNLGCLQGILHGFQNAALYDVPGVDYKLDATGILPWPDASISLVRAEGFVEHLTDKTQTMNEIWRVLQPGGVAEVTVPTAEGRAAFQDPGHRSFWNRRSFLYFEAGNPYCERFATFYGTLARFRLLREEQKKTAEGPYLTVLLEAVK
jgi:SAM-dependent methyltransferase